MYIGPLTTAARLLAALGGVALLITRECNPWFLSGFGGLWLAGVGLRRSTSLVRWAGRAQPVMALVALGVAALDFTSVSQSFLLAVAHFLLAIAGLRLLALQTVREVLGSVLLSSLMMLSCATLAVDWTFLLLLMVFVPMLVWTLMVYTISREADEAARAPLLPWSHIKLPLRRMAGLAVGITMACCAGVFALFPRFNFQAFRGHYLQPLHTTGFTQQVDLQNGGRIYSDNSVVMRIEVPKEDLPNWTGYLRGSALEEYDNGVWRRAPLAMERFFGQTGGEFHFGRQAWEVGGRRLRQTVYLETMETTLLFLAPNVLSLNINRPFVEVSSDGAVQRRGSDGWRIRYQVESEPTLVPNSGGRLQQVEFPHVFTSKWRDEDVLNANRKVPKNLPPRVSLLARQLIPDPAHPLSAVEAVGDYLQRECTYSLHLPVAPAGMTPLENFLFNAKIGHCEFFASAACLLLRSQGIPARVVTGFLSHERNTRGDYFVVRMKHAHAWVEFYAPQSGWMMFDPSPRDAVGDVERDDVSAWGETWDYVNLRWNRYILSYDFERQVALVQSLTNTSSQLSEQLGQWIRPTTWMFSWRGFSGLAPGGSVRPMGVPWGWVLVAAGLLAAGLGWAHRRQRRMPAVWFFPRYARFLERVVGPRHASSSMREWMEKSLPHVAGLEEDVRFVETCYERLRYGQGEELPPALRTDIHQRLKKLSSWRKRAQLR